jgi:ribosomal-protein-alanine N-acetyltransferase
MITYREMIALDIPVLVGMEKEIYPESPWSAAQFREELAGIHTLTVTPKFRRQGIATELLQQLEEWASAQGITTFMLEMREGNSEAQPLYEKHGYEVISKRDNYYSRGIHALIMRKEAGK